MGDMADYYLSQSLDAYWETDMAGYDNYALTPWRSDYIKPHGPGLCPKCKATTTERNGPYGKFYGCTRFPQCRGSRNL